MISEYPYSHLLDNTSDQKVDLADRLTDIMTEIDASKDVYLFLHGKMDLMEKATNALTARGFAAEKITMAVPNKTGKVGDYMAMLWMPPNPDQIKIQQITKVEEVEPEGMIGLWKGVAKDDIETIMLERS